jgi:integrase
MIGFSAAGTPVSMPASSRRVSRVLVYVTCPSEGRWKLQWKGEPDADGRRPQGGRTFNIETEAYRWKSVFEEVGIERGLALLDGKVAVEDAGPQTVTQVVERHITAMTGITPKYRQDCLGMLKNHITPTLGTVLVDQLTRDQCAAWVNMLADEKKLSGKAVRNIHAVLSGALAWAIERGMRQDNRNPAYRLRLPRSSRMEEPVFLSPAEVSELLATIRPFYRDFVLVALGTGMRFAELAGRRAASSR